MLVELIHKRGVVEHILVIKLADSIHGLVHAVITYAYVVGKMEHLTCLALGPSAHKADVLVPGLILLIIARSAGTGSVLSIYSLSLIKFLSVLINLSEVQFVVFVICDCISFLFI